MFLANAAITVVAVNMAWLIIFGIRDHLKRREMGEIRTNLSIAIRNLKGCCINVAVVIFLNVLREWNRS